MTGKKMTSRKSWSSDPSSRPVPVPAIFVSAICDHFDYDYDANSNSNTDDYDDYDFNYDNDYDNGYVNDDDDIDDEEFDQVQRLLLGGDNEFNRVAFPVAEIILIIIHKY